MQASFGFRSLFGCFLHIRPLALSPDQYSRGAVAGIYWLRHDLKRDVPLPTRGGNVELHDSRHSMTIKNNQVRRGSGLEVWNSPRTTFYYSTFVIPEESERYPRLIKMLKCQILCSDRLGFFFFKATVSHLFSPTALKASLLIKSS